MTCLRDPWPALDFSLSSRPTRLSGETSMSALKSPLSLLISSVVIALTLSCIAASAELTSLSKQTVPASSSNAGKRPISIRQFHSGKMRLAATMAECQQALRDAVALCDSLFNATGSAHYRNTQWHSTCLANARTQFDNCRSTVGQQTRRRSTNHPARARPRHLRCASECARMALTARLTRSVGQFIPRCDRPGCRGRGSFCARCCD